MDTQILRAANAMSRLLLHECGDAGVLHILFDGNVGDDHMGWMADDITKHGASDLERDCFEKFSLMPEDDRESAYDLANELYPIYLRAEATRAATPTPFQQLRTASAALAPSADDPAP